MLLIKNIVEIQKKFSCENWYSIIIHILFGQIFMLIMSFKRFPLIFYFGMSFSF